jgi:ketosteroid isomerase-like protein
VPTPPPDDPAAGGARAGASPEEAVLGVNAAFYEAFEARDLDAMSDVWEHSERAACTHPGWATLHGWAAVSSSWMALFTRGEPLQFIVTAVRATVEGTAAWVTCEEGILGSAGASSAVAAINVFAQRDDGTWRMVGHHASPVAGP